jgi:hypothetical protein
VINVGFTATGTSAFTLTAVSFLQPQSRSKNNEIRAERNKKDSHRLPRRDERSESMMSTSG